MLTQDLCLGKDVGEQVFCPECKYRGVEEECSQKQFSGFGDWN